MTRTLCKLLRTQFQNGNSSGSRSTLIPGDTSPNLRGPPEKLDPQESNQSVGSDLFSEKACNSLFIRYNHAHGNHAAAKRGHRLPVQLHPEKRLLAFLRG